MKFHFHREFEKGYKRLKENEQKRVRDRLNLFRENPFHPLLKSHPLQGEYAGYYSVSIAGDLRAIFKRVGADECWFVKLGTHRELYSE
jgi:addiction module RelE/StbE family toxin